MDTFKSKKEALSYDDVNIIPKYSNIKSRSNIDLSSRVSVNFEVDVPIISSPMDTISSPEMASELSRLGAMAVVNRRKSIEDQVEECESSNADPLCAAIGATGDYLDRAKALVEEADVDILLIDVAHGHHMYVRNALVELSMMFPDEVDLMAGNIATKQGAEDLIEWGADSLRVGVGSGSTCTTRLRAGTGIPMITTIRRTVSVAERRNIPVIADGGARYVGDIAKALAAGADAVMCGNILAGTKETPGDIHREGKWPEQELYKRYRGSASEAAKKDNEGIAENVEGQSGRVAYKGPVKRIITDIKEGLQSAYSYTGAKNTEQFHAKADLQRVSQSGAIEGHAHFLL